MTAPKEYPVQIISPDIRHSPRISVNVTGAETMPEALKLVREWAEDVARCEGMAVDVTQTAVEELDPC